MAKKIMLVDDETELRDLVAMRLKSFGYEVCAAANGDEAMILLDDTIPDLILLDVMMPGKDGYEICNEIKTNEKTSHVPIILFTAKPEQKEKLKSNYDFMAADDYILKPFEPEDLLIKIKRFIG
ncbi:MAG: response regulator [Candidatus Omnitrophota bacterium]|jgi:two-component system alkaline phosphatase synthesis response regulator PhoP